MEFNFEQARRLEGKMIRFKNKQGEMAIGKVIKVTKDGLEIEELRSSGTDDGYGYGVCGRPFWGPPVFFPFVGFRPFPFFFW